MSAKKRRDWIVMNPATAGEKAHALECRRCGAIQPIAMPIAIEVLAAAGKAFERMHAHCPKRNPPARRA